MSETSQYRSARIFVRILFVLCWSYIGFMMVGAIYALFVAGGEASVDAIQLKLMVLLFGPPVVFFLHVIGTAVQALFDIADSVRQTANHQEVQTGYLRQLAKSK